MKKLGLAFAVLLLLTGCGTEKTSSSVNSAEVHQAEKSEKEKAFDDLIARKEEEHRKIHENIKKHSDEIQQEFDRIRAERQNQVGGR